MSYYAPAQLTVTPETALYTSVVPDVNMSVDTSQGRTALIFDFESGDGLYSRDLGTVFSWPITAGTILDVWQPSFIIEPETTVNRATDWMDGGNIFAKWIQGVIVTGNTSGLPKTLSLQSGDDNSTHALHESPSSFGVEQTTAFSCHPFIAHNARLTSDDGVAWSNYQSQLIYQPWPELCIEWQSELVSLGITGYAHAREMNIAYASESPITITLGFDDWPAQTYSLPATEPSGTVVQSKVKVPLQVNKWKLISFGAISPTPFYLFREDIEFKVKAWGSTSAYGIVKPFGGASSAGAIV
jgi:hypothetical protein